MQKPVSMWARPREKNPHFLVSFCFECSENAAGGGALEYVCSRLVSEKQENACQTYILISALEFEGTNLQAHWSYSWWRLMHETNMHHVSSCVGALLMQISTNDAQWALWKPLSGLSVVFFLWRITHKHFMFNVPESWLEFANCALFWVLASVFCLPPRPPNHWGHGGAGSCLQSEAERWEYIWQ